MGAVCGSGGYERSEGHGFEYRSRQTDAAFGHLSMALKPLLLWAAR